MIKILKEDYKSIAKAQLALLQYSSTLQYQYPADIDEERLLCVTIGLQTICNKILAYQPSQEEISYSIKSKLNTYFGYKKNLKPSDNPAKEQFNKYLSYSKLIYNFVTKPPIVDITKEIKDVRDFNDIKKLREDLLNKADKKLFSNTVKEYDIEHNKVYISQEEFAKLWNKIVSSNSTITNNFKNSFVRGKYIALLPNKKLIETLMAPAFYKGLASDSIRTAVSIIKDVFSLIKDEEKNKIYELTNSSLSDYRNQIYSFQAEHEDTSKYQFTDLFYVTDKYKLKSALSFFINLMMKDKTDLFYIKYQLNKINDTFFTNFDSLLDTSIETFNEEFNKLQKVKEYDLWQSETFRMIWLLFTIWFRKQYQSKSSL
ncbi:MAG: hypothetical protein K5622_05725 [Endomicrobiaceae bacterium]|nr:hypothetical protein [Endomicrobiaceae bacterium]